MRDTSNPGPRRRRSPGALIVVALLAVSISLHADPRLQLVRARGFLVCGVSTGIVGFAVADAQGRYRGLDVDVCRAVAAAIFGSDEKVRYVETSTLEQFLSTNDIDIVSRRLTWSLRREGLGLLFGPVIFYDGQGFMVPRQRQLRTVRQLSNQPICVVPGAENEFNLNTYFKLHNLQLKKVLLRSPQQAETELLAGHCQAFTADISMLASVRSTMLDGGKYEILPERISKEPLAQVVRQNDDQFFNIVRWTVFALIAAEELGVTSANIEEMTRSADPDVKRLLGVLPGNGRALGLDEKWALNAIRAVGNYGEAFERNVGLRSPLQLERGLNRLWTNGGLMYAPSLQQ